MILFSIFLAITLILVYFFLFFWHKTVLFVQLFSEKFLISSRGSLVRMAMCFFGLKQARRSWFEKFRAVIVGAGFIQSKVNTIMLSCC